MSPDALWRAPNYGSDVRAHTCSSLRPGVLCRENRFLLEERDLMQQQLQQLAERTPTRTARRGAGDQGTPFDAQGTPFDTPCTRGAQLGCNPAF